MSAYIGNRKSANESVLESSPVAQAVRAFIEDEKIWKNTATELLMRLNDLADEPTKKRRENQKTWPKTGKAISNELRRIAPNLRAAGVAIEFDDSGRPQAKTNYQDRMAGLFIVRTVRRIKPKRKKLPIRKLKPRYKRSRF